MNEKPEETAAPEPLPPMDRSMIENVRAQLRILSVVTIKDQQFNFRVLADEAAQIIEDWAFGTRDGTAALSFWAQSIEGRGFIGKWVFPTAMIAQIRIYTEDELAELQARAKAAQALRPGRG